jgi:hypothetical protein
MAKSRFPARFSGLVGLSRWIYPPAMWRKVSWLRNYILSKKGISCLELVQGGFAIPGNNRIACLRDPSQIVYAVFIASSQLMNRIRIISRTAFASRRFAFGENHGKQSDHRKTNSQ